jgi:hypothetical protein
MAKALEKRSPDSVLLITLDSCRFDTFLAAVTPHMKAVGPLHRARAPSYYTYGSHSAMFVGFTPGLAHLAQPFLNPKFGKVFKLVGTGFPGKGSEAYTLGGRDIIQGFRELGFQTIGSGAVGWFDPDVPTGKHLTQHFDEFLYPGNPYSLRRQLGWLSDRLNSTRRDVFAFLNVGETHVPYWFEGAPWSIEDNPCVPFQTEDRSADCRLRQRSAAEFVDRELQDLLQAFMSSTILICGDHGDSWGEDGLWEHGFSSEATLTVPLLLRVRGAPIAEDAGRAVSNGARRGFAARARQAGRRLQAYFSRNAR